MKKFLLIALCLTFFPNVSYAAPDNWKREWPNTDFTKSTVNFSEIISGGPPKDGIPAIDNPKFKPTSEITDIGGQEPVIFLQINSEAKAYPLRILMWHEIANDTVGGVPVTVTFCPLCNASIVFDRRVNNQTLDFGVSGKLRHSDMIMYDRQTESWWQQFVGKAIVGKMTGTALKRLPAKIMPFASFKSTYPEGTVLLPPTSQGRRYGVNPYVKYDSLENPFLYKGRYDGPGSPMSYVVSIDKEAWLLTDIRKAGEVTHNDIRIQWQKGMNSSLDSEHISKGRDIGFVTVQRKTENGYEDIPYDTTFAFAFKAFYPDGIIYENKYEQ